MKIYARLLMEKALLAAMVQDNSMQPGAPKALVLAQSVLLPLLQSFPNIYLTSFSRMCYGYTFLLLSRMREP